MKKLDTFNWLLTIFFASILLATIIFFGYVFFIFVTQIILPSKVSVNKLVKEIELNPNVEKIDNYFQDDEGYEAIYADIRLKNGLRMSFNDIKMGEKELIFQDLRKMNGFVPMVYIYKKDEGICTFDEFCTQYLYSTHNLNDWIENSESIYKKLQKLPLVEIKNNCTKEFFDALSSEFTEENEKEIKKYFKWKRE